MRKTIVASLLVFVLAVACVGANKYQDVLVVTLSAEVIAEATYTVIRTAWHEGIVSDEDMVKADKLMQEFIDARKKFKKAALTFEKYGGDGSPMSELKEKMNKVKDKLKALAIKLKLEVN